MLKWLYQNELKYQCMNSFMIISKKKTKQKTKKKKKKATNQDYNLHIVTA